MSAKAVLTGLFLISLCVVVVLGLRAFPQKVVGNPAPEMHEILVATAQLAPGTLLRAKDVAWQSIKGSAEAGLILQPSIGSGNPNPELEQQARAEVYGAALRIGVGAGAPITRGAIVRPGDRDFLQIVLSPGARAIAIPVVMGGASTGILYPGDWVDVVLTQTFKSDLPLKRRSVGETVVQNLRVLAVDPPDAKAGAAGNNFGRTVTLEVTPEQAERVNVAAELGKLSLTLRNVSTSDGNGIATAAAPLAAAVKPIWAGDISPALDEATPIGKIVTAEQPVIEVFHGAKTVVKAK